IGAPVSLCNTLQAPIGLAHLGAATETLRAFQFETAHGNNYVRHEPIGVAALITAWNWPLSLICAKVAAALAA
ncbi:MAG TPA: aldehyde dehydrogenase family protein, partial [Cupriavidus sp.]|nr:aldehyde dehydrogenase family protein [Cupriavidus sp.]